MKIAVSNSNNKEQKKLKLLSNVRPWRINRAGSVAECGRDVNGQLDVPSPKGKPLDLVQRQLPKTSQQFSPGHLTSQLLLRNTTVLHMAAVCIENYFLHIINLCADRAESKTKSDDIHRLYEFLFIILSVSIMRDV